MKGIMHLGGESEENEDCNNAVFAPSLGEITWNNSFNGGLRRFYSINM